MRKVNNLQNLISLIRGSFKPDEVTVEENSDNDIVIYAPYLPSSVIYFISSKVRVGVYPYSVSHVMINLYKL